LFEIPVDFLAAYFNGALVSSIDWWLENMEQVSVEEMTRMFQRLFFPARARLWVCRNWMIFDPGECFLWLPMLPK
jgi:hypothetical protein